MIKRSLLPLCCVCVIAVCFWNRLSTQSVKPSLPQANIPDQWQPVSSAAAIVSPKPAREVVPVPMLAASNYVVTSEATATNVSSENPGKKDQMERHGLLRELREWAAKDPEAALMATLKLPEGDDRIEALEAVCFGIAQNDPADAVKTAESLHLGDKPGAVLENLVQQWATADISSALDWANSQPAGTQRDGLNMRIAYVLSQNDPAGAANLVVSQIPPGPTQDEAIMTVLNQLANQNLAAAASWAKGFPAGPLRDRAISELEGIQNRQAMLTHQ